MCPFDPFVSGAKSTNKDLENGAFRSIKTADRCAR